MGNVCGSKNKSKHNKQSSNQTYNKSNLVTKGHRPRSSISESNNVKNANINNVNNVVNNNVESEMQHGVSTRTNNLNVRINLPIPDENLINIYNNVHPVDILSSRNGLNLAHDSNNGNVSINDEFSSRRNPVGVTSNVNLYPSYVNREAIPITLRNLRDNRSQEHQYCNYCSRTYANVTEYRQHFPLCNGLRSNQLMHNSINEILQLVQSLNRHLQGDTLLSLLGQEEPEESSEYIDWSHFTTEDGNVIWKKRGKVILTKEEMNKIAQKKCHRIKTEKYYLKRIWLLKYINKNIYDKSGDNTTIVVSRENIFEESFNQFKTTQELDLKKAMHIFFVDEVAHDVGGVYREWYTCLFDSIFSPDQGFFYRIEDKCVGKNSFFIPSTLPNLHSDNYKDYYEFIGQVIAKAIFDKITIKTNFNFVLLKLFLKKNLSIDDLKYLDSGYYFSLKSILENKMSDNSELFFTWNIRKENGQMEEVELIPDGNTTMLNEQNKLVFIEKVVNFICYKSVKEKVDSLMKGFYSLIPFDIINIFSPEEFDFLLSGQSEIDLNDWEANTVYKGYYNDKHPTIQLFWEILKELPSEKVLLFYKFCTGCTRVPIDGFNSLPGTRNKYQKFCIESPAVKNNCDINRLIEAKTCFNRIYLPDYNSKELMLKVINTIIDNDTNFFGEIKVKFIKC